MRFAVLGPVQVTGPQGAVELGGGKQRTLFALLVAARGQVVSTTRIVDEVWGEDPPAKVSVSVQSYVANLRRALEPLHPAMPGPIRTSRPGYLLEVDPSVVDEHEFTRLSNEARACLSQNPQRARDLLLQAESLWRGDAYADVLGAPSLAAESTRLTELRALAREDRWRANLAIGSPAQVVAEIEPFIAAHPLREGVWALLALALYRSGRQADALAALGRARTVLSNELGIDPGPELRRLETQILRHEVELAEPAGSPPPTALSPTLIPIGREAPLAQLNSALDAARAGRGSAVLLTGEPGIGKTTLASALAETAAAHGMRTGWGAVDDSGSAPSLWPLTLAVGELVAGLDDRIRTRGAESAALVPLLPQLAETLVGDRVAVPDADTERFRLVRALATVLTDVVGPALLVVDDVQWADEPTLLVLRALSPLLSRLPVLVVVISRAPIDDSNSSLAALLADLTRSRTPRIALSGLPREDVAAFVTARGNIAHEHVVDALHARTEGNPFYLGELVTALSTDDGLSDPAAVESLDVPDGVRDVVRARLRGLTTDAAHYLEAAAIAGQQFDPRVVAVASGLAADTGADVEATTRANGFTTDADSGRHRFRHAIVRQAVEARIPRARRADLHARLATAMADATNESSDAAIAAHYAAAGPEFAGRARQFAITAGLAAERRGVFDQARQLYEIALAAGDTAAPPPTPTERYELLVSLARANKNSGYDRQAWTYAHSAAMLALDAGEVVNAARAAVEVGSNAVWSWREYREVDFAAIALFDRLIETLPDNESELAAAARASLASELYYWPEEYERAVALSDRALELARAHGTSALSRTLELRHVATERPASLADRMRTSTELVALAESRYDDIALCRALVFRGRDRVESGDFTSGNGDYERAERVARRLAFAPVLVVLAWWEAALDLAAGRFGEGAAAAERAEALHGRTTLPGTAEIPLLLAATHHLARGTLADATAEFAMLAEQTGLALLADLRDLGRLTGARDTPAVVLGAGLVEPPPDYMWLAHQTIRARILAIAGPDDAAARLERNLLPYRGRIAIGGTGICIIGTVDHGLGLLARRRGDLDAAIDAFGAALDLETASGMHAFAAATATECARTLTQRAGAGDPVRAEELDAWAATVAGQTGQRLP
ncbi:AfsR/SARP family transcriptional regulator [Aldersonia kunmingensis]|uniref:AfsR/SARP family transcriptional regulator n=1 Tax=Aldersonia kunmingensis TaxID=408066 RepID=UPI000A66B07D|nr:AfsR/SARP family transcriptional regulator [Aldersonia kunmingensis]